MATPHLDLVHHPIADTGYITKCRDRLNDDGALVLSAFATADAVRRIVADHASQESDAYYANKTHNVYLTPSDPDLKDSHPYNRQVQSSKGLIADNQIPAQSILREIYNDASFKTFLCGVLGIGHIYPYDDHYSSINVHYAPDGMELGWHFDNSSFAVTMLLQSAEAGANFEYIPAVRNAAAGDMAFDRVGKILDGEEEIRTLDFNPGDLVVFRGRDSIHRVTPTKGETTRMLVVFAYNDKPGIALSESALRTFYGPTK